MDSSAGANMMQRSPRMLMHLMGRNPRAPNDVFPIATQKCDEEPSSHLSDTAARLLESAHAAPHIQRSGDLSSDTTPHWVMAPLAEMDSPADKREHHPSMTP